MKKFLAIGAIGLAACVAAASGCGTKLKNYASMASNWYSYPDNDKIQPAFSATSEKMRYSVEQTELSKNGVYEVKYETGEYVTEFTAEKIGMDKLAEIASEEFRNEYAAKTGGAEDESEKFMILYRYSTQLSVPKVTYTFGTETKTFENEYRNTTSYFMSVEDYLSPVYSITEIKCASPASTSPEKPKTLENCYIEVDRVYESFYSFTASDVRTKVYDRAEDRELATVSVSKLNSGVYSVFDSAYLDVVARAMKGTTAQTVSLYTPGNGAAEYVISGSDAPISDNAELLEAQLSNISKVLEGKNLLAVEDAEQLSTTALSITFNNTHPGTSQTYWFANANNNGKRSVMIKYSCPLAYDAGRLEYVLRDIESLPDV